MQSLLFGVRKWKDEDEFEDLDLISSFLQSASVSFIQFPCLVLSCCFVIFDLFTTKIKACSFEPNCKWLCSCCFHNNCAFYLCDNLLNHSGEPFPLQQWFSTSFCSMISSILSTMWITCWPPPLCFWFDQYIQHSLLRRRNFSQPQIPLFQQSKNFKWPCLNDLLASNPPCPTCVESSLEYQSSNSIKLESLKICFFPSSVLLFSISPPLWQPGLPTKDLPLSSLLHLSWNSFCALLDQS